MIKTGLEIVGMIAKGNIPKVIKVIEEDKKYYWDKILEDYFDGTTENTMLGILTYLNEEFEIIEENKVWKPELGEKHYFIDRFNEVDWEMWNNNPNNNYRYEIGNCFKTKENAEKTLEKIKIYMQLKRYAEEHNAEKIDWKNEEQGKWHIEYMPIDEDFDFAMTTYWKEIGQVYFTSRGICERAIKEIGEDNIRKLFEEEK